MLYEEGREKKAEKGDVVNRKRGKSVHSIADQNHQSCENWQEKRGRRIKLLWCIIVISNVRARDANVNDVIVLSQPPRPH